jgi:Cytochrome c556
MPVRTRAATALAAILLFPSAAAVANEPIVEYRESVMEAIGGHTGALKQLITGKVDFPGDAKTHVLGLAALSKMVDHIFPAGSGSGDTDALPAIWEKPAEFKKAVEAFQTAAADLAQQADAAPSAMAPAFGALVKTCKGCHDDFKKK